jgi:hypothetical protein
MQNEVQHKNVCGRNIYCAAMFNTATGKGKEAVALHPHTTSFSAAYSMQPCTATQQTPEPVQNCLITASPIP